MSTLSEQASHWNGTSIPMPRWMESRWPTDEIPDSDVGLYSAAVATLWVRMAVESLENPHDVSGWGNQRRAEYHAYAGVSASRTAIDYASQWILCTYFPDSGLRPTEQTVTAKKFRRLVRQHCPELDPLILRLNEVAAEIDPVRIAIQHRHQAAVVLATIKEDDPDESARWYFSPPDWSVLSVPTTRLRQDVVHLLSDWASRIDAVVEQLVKEIPSGRSGPRGS